MADIVCPTGCDDVVPVVSFDDCNPEFMESEIKKIYVASGGAIPFEDWSDATEWGERVSQSGTPPTGSTVAAKDLIRPLTVIGDKPEPTSVTRELSNRRTRTIGKDHTINFTIDELTQENRDFQRKTECGSAVRVWYEIHGGLMFGGNEGILGNLTSNLVLARGTDEIALINGTVTWRSKFTEESIPSPLATAA
jgi:uncharacterized protein YheU (UPF0270 family)